MNPAAKRPKRAPRADATRNRERLLDAAKSVFSAGGRAPTLEGVARKAGVGIGTLYRHFPTRAALYEAVYRRDIDHVVALAEAPDEGDSVEALRLWLHAVVDMVATKKGMVAAFALGADTTSAISGKLSCRLVVAMEPLLARAVAQGRVRPDVRSEELLLSVVGMCLLQEGGGWEASVKRLTDSLVAGLSASGGERG